MRRVIWGIVLLLLVGCGTESVQPTTNSAGAAAATATAPATAAPTAAPTTAAPAPGGAPEVVATLETSGGIAGISQRLVVWSDGKLELASASNLAAPIRLGQASPEQIQELQTAINRPEFKALNGNYLPENTCCDFFTYVLSAGGTTITTMDGIAWPEPLETVLKLLFDLQSGVTADTK